MDLSLGNNNNVEKDNVTTGGACSSSTSTTSGSIEKEHMFDKVVTPSDVGKLNRLVIPKQHAEKYFPLDSSSVDKGLLLTFEDRLGKPWRFRYSYWNSSQSYVMTKGWSRFVKEKKLDAGDIVSFHRGVGESGRHRLFIDWRHRPIVSDPPALHHHHHINQMPFLHPVAWGNLYSLPRSLSMMPRDQLPQFPPPPNFTSSVQDYPPYHLPQRHLSQQYHHQYHHHHNQQAAAGYGDGNAGTGEQYYLRPAEGMQIGGLGLVHHHQQRGGGDDGHNDDDLPMVNVIHSVPVVHGQTVGKRLRLFGVNMECPIQDDHHQMLSSSPHLPSSSSLHVPPPPPQLTQRVAAAVEAKNSKKGKSTSLSFDLDL